MSSSPNMQLEPPLNENKEFSKEWNLFLDEITEENREHARKINYKEKSFYPLDIEILNDQKFFNPSSLENYRSAFRKLVDFGALPNTATKNVAHGLTPTASWMFTKIYAFARDPAAPEWLTVPNEDIFIKATSANISITTKADFSSFTDCYCILEYLKY
jgi:hypothetical protein